MSSETMLALAMWLTAVTELCGHSEPVAVRVSLQDVLAWSVGPTSTGFANPYVCTLSNVLVRNYSGVQRTTQP
jgi:hypothetical protein